MISDMVSTPERAANAEYSFSDVVQMTVCAQIAGATAMEHVSKICGDEIISRCAGWEKVPHATNIGRIIKSVRERNISELEALVPKLRDKVWKRMLRSGRKLACAMTDMIIDMDSTVQGVCGHQEGAPPLADTTGRQAGIIRQAAYPQGARQVLVSGTVATQTSVQTR